MIGDDLRHGAGIVAIRPDDRLAQRLAPAAGTHIDEFGRLADRADLLEPALHQHRRFEGELRRETPR